MRFLFKHPTFLLKFSFYFSNQELYLFIDCSLLITTSFSFYRCINNILISILKYRSESLNISFSEIFVFSLGSVFSCFLLSCWRLFSNVLVTCSYLRKRGKLNRCYFLRLQFFQLHTSSLLYLELRIVWPLLVPFLACFSPIQTVGYNFLCWFISHCSFFCCFLTFKNLIEIPTPLMPPCRFSLFF